MPVMGTDETVVGIRAHPVFLGFVVDELGLEHQLCLAHVRKAVTSRLREVEGWEEEKATSSGWFVNCPEVVVLSFSGWSSGCSAPRRCEGWWQTSCSAGPAWSATVAAKGVPATNNRTEQAIRKSKVRFKTVRGFKSVAGALAAVALTQWLYRRSGSPQLGGAGRVGGRRT